MSMDVSKAFLARACQALALLLIVVVSLEIALELAVAELSLLAGLLLLAACILALGQRLARIDDAARRAADERTRRILETTNEAYVAMDEAGRVTAWNAAAESTFGWRRAEAIGRELANLIVPVDMREAHRRGLTAFLATGHGPMVGPRTELVASHRDGSEIPVEISITAIEEDGDWSFHGFVRDITERKMLESQQAQLLARAEETARIDPLTSLPNRRHWDEELARELALARRRHSPLCVALLDLDRFKDFNDAHGHREGDRMLRKSAAAWRMALRGSDFLARYGGEEFAVLLPDCELGDAATVIERLRPATPEGQTVSAGIAEWNGYEATSALLDRADLALYEAKRGGRDRVEVAGAA